MWAKHGDREEFTLKEEIRLKIIEFGKDLEFIQHRKRNKETTII